MKKTKSPAAPSRHSAAKLTPYTQKQCENVMYFDNNSTTLMSPDAASVYNSWLRCYNISSDSKVSKPAKLMVEKVKKYILQLNGTDDSKHTVIFTSGGTESNCFVLKSVCAAYAIKKHVVPHVISSAIEHHSILECLHLLEKDGRAEVSLVKPNCFGQISPGDVQKLIKSNTAIISIIYANNETGAINNVPAIGKIAHDKRIPMHSDCVQIYGKYKLNLMKSNIDAISVSCHKFYGPKGVGFVILNNDLITGYELKAEIAGTQQYGLRGGTENVPAIAATAVALQSNFVGRPQKNNRQLALSNHLLSELKKNFAFGRCENYAGGDDNTRKPFEFVVLGVDRGKSDSYLFNTVMIAAAKNKGSHFCNVKFKQFLDRANIVVSITSACLTSSSEASHVLKAMNMEPVIKRGVIRISFSDLNTKQEVDFLVKKINEYCIPHRDEALTSKDVVEEVEDVTELHLVAS